MNMTEGKIAKPIVLFSLPVMAGLLLQNLYSAVDGIVVGNFVSEAALAGIGTSAPLCALLLALASGFATGSGVVISQLFGAKRTDEMPRTVSTTLIIMLSLGAVLSVVGFIISRPFLEHILGVQEEYMGFAVTYMRVYCAGLVFQFAYNAFSGILQAIGDSKSTLLFLAVASVINIILDIIFVRLFSWAVFGVAIATVISQAASVAACIIYVRKRYAWLMPGRKNFSIDGNTFKAILKLGLPSSIQTMLLSIAALCLQRLVNNFGVATVAAQAASARMEQFMTIPIMGFGTGLSTFTGQNIGAGRMDRVKQGLRSTLAIGGIGCVLLAAITYIAAPQLIGIFGIEGEALDIGTNIMRVMSSFLVCFSVLFIVKSLLIGSGDVVVPTVITIAIMGARIFAAYWMAYNTNIGYMALPYSMATDFIVGMILMVGRYMQGSWKKKAVVTAAVETV